MTGWYDGGPGWAGWLVMTLLALAFWALLVFGGLALYRSLRRDDTGSAGSRDDAKRPLDERFARSEIDADEYARRCELLRSGR